MSSVAPFATTVPEPAPVAPSALTAVTDTMPALMLVAPVYVLLPERISVPVFVLVSDPAPETLPPQVSAVPPEIV